jgi:hypothetical protein
MDRSRIGGALICLGTVVLSGLFLWGIAVRNYWALAIPVLVAFLGVMALGFWIGWTMAVTETEPPVVEPKEEPTSASSPNSSS